MNDQSEEALMKEAFQALLRGDTKRRDEICDRLISRRNAVEKERIDLAVQAAPYFTKQ